MWTLWTRKSYVCWCKINPAWSLQCSCSTCRPNDTTNAIIRIKSKLIRKCLNTKCSFGLHQPKPAADTTFFGFLLIYKSTSLDYRPITGIAGNNINAGWEPGWYEGAMQMQQCNYFDRADSITANFNVEYNLSCRSQFDLECVKRRPV